MSSLFVPEGSPFAFIDEDSVSDIEPHCFEHRPPGNALGRLLIAALVSFHTRLVGGLLFGFEDLLELFNYIFCMRNVLVFRPIGNTICVFVISKS